MATILENIQRARFLPTRPLKDDLPTFQSGGGDKDKESHLTGLRKRLSSFSGKIQPISSEWAFRRSKSAPSLATAFASGHLKRWWEWVGCWLLLSKKKPGGFAGDLEMREEEGRQSRGSSWGHIILYKVRSGVRRLVASAHSSLPTTTQKQSSLPGVQKAQLCKPAAFAYAPRQSFRHNGHAMAH